MATSVQDRDQTAPSGVRRAARTGYRCLLIVASAGVQYGLVRRR